MSADPGRLDLAWKGRVVQMVGVAVLHVSCYYLVNAFNGFRSPAAFWNLRTAVDQWIPYLPWTWPFYYSAHFYVTLWAAFVLWGLPGPEFKRAIRMYMSIILAGALVQLALPAEAPWPRALHATQKAMHNVLSMRPYACLPSMHVALSVLPAGISLVALRSPWLKGGSAALALLITISTLTMKEHYFLDTLTGFLLGVLAAAFWYWASPRMKRADSSAACV